MQTLPTELIEKSLALTGKTMEEVSEAQYWNNWTPVRIQDKFSIEKFCYYLLSESFIEDFYYKADYSSLWNDRTDLSAHIGIAIYKYQKWDPEPLIELLSNI